MRSYAHLTQRHIALAALVLAMILSAVTLTQSARADVATTIGGHTFTSVGNEMVPYNGYLYFAADDGTHGNELWRTDGTAAGTSMVADLSTDPNTGKTNPMRLTVTNNRLFFNVRTTGGDLGGIYVYNGSGTPVPVPPPGSDLSGGILGTVNDRLLYRGYTGTGTQGGSFYMAAVAPGTTNVTNASLGIDVGNTGQSPAATMGGYAYFWGATSALGSELYRTNGTSTQLVKDILSPGASSPDGFITVGNLVFFTAVNPVNRRELWRTDGTDAGTFRVSNHITGTGDVNIRDFTAHGDKLYYVASDSATGREVWVSDGTIAGTHVVKDIVPGSQGSAPYGLTSVGGKVFFFLPGESWVTDGTDAGTQKLADLPYAGYTAGEPLAAGGRFYFRAGSTWGNIVWRSDGTPGGTFPLTAGAYDAAPSNGAMTSTIGVLGSRVIFASNHPANPSGAQLNVIDMNAPDPVRAPTVAPSLSGTGVVNTVLTIQPGSWTMSPQWYTYQWYSNGQPIRSTGLTQNLGPAYLGARIHATVTAYGLGAPPVTVATASVLVTPAGSTQPPVTKPPVKKLPRLTVKKKPKITGVVRVGSTLTAQLPQFAQTKVRVKYQWLANGKVIAKATKRTFKLTKYQQGKKITVRVTGTKVGFAATPSLSAATKKVAKKPVVKRGAKKR